MTRSWTAGDSASSAHASAEVANPLTARDYLELRIERAVFHGINDVTYRRDVSAYEYLYGKPALDTFLLAARTRSGI